MIRKSILAACLATVASASSPLVIPTSALAQSNLKNFYDFYTYCDAKKIAHAWNMNIGQAKVLMNDKLVGNNISNAKAILDRAIEGTGRAAPCTFDEANLSYNDATVMAKYWGVNVSRAKSKMDMIVTQSGSRGMAQPLLNAKQQAGNSQPNNGRWLANYADFYTYCDAKKVAHAWNMDIGQAKVLINDKMVEGNRQNAKAILKQAILSSGQAAPCTYEEANLTYKDAEVMAKYWGRTVGDAKTKMDQIVTKEGSWGMLQPLANARAQFGFNLYQIDSGVKTASLGFKEFSLSSTIGKLKEVTQTNVGMKGIGFQYGAGNPSFELRSLS